MRTRSSPAWSSTSPRPATPTSRWASSSRAASTASSGSSNLTAPALTTGVEWNYRAVSSREGGAFEDVVRGFEQLFAHRATHPLDEEWIEAYRRRRQVLVRKTREAVPLEAEPEPATPATPHSIQQEALAALQATRQNGNAAGLVVLATGLGKTWLSAVDSNRPDYRRILFVAHREEILRQARSTFRHIRPQARLGLYMADDRAPEADVLFASIQTLGRIGTAAAFRARP